MSKPDVAALKRKRGSDRAKVTLFRKFIDNVKTIQSLNSVQLTELKNRLTEFKLVYPSFDETQTLIESIDDISEVDEVDPVREQFENDYHLLVAVATELIRKHDPEDSEYGTDRRDDHHQLARQNVYDTAAPHLKPRPAVALPWWPAYRTTFHHRTVRDGRANFANT
ncbi:hypothetical protein NE865_07333 [Phthorimaea operculella]|nr:hypothetical protein NE865_07333 [Phthorimaea operculella]